MWQVASLLMNNMSGARNSGVWGEIGSVGIGGRFALGDRGGIEAHCRFFHGTPGQVAFALNDK